jgi:hypothetical protein
VAAADSAQAVPEAASEQVAAELAAAAVLEVPLAAAGVVEAQVAVRLPEVEMAEEAAPPSARY